MGIKQYHLLIHGHVQGVGYRYYAQQYAQKLGLTGWVRNLADGGVEIVAEGDTALLEQLISWGKQGPRYANVRDVELTQLTATSEFRDFSIR